MKINYLETTQGVKLKELIKKKNELVKQRNRAIYETIAVVLATVVLFSAGVYLWEQSRLLSFTSFFSGALLGFIRTSSPPYFEKK